LTPAGNNKMGITKRNVIRKCGRRIYGGIYVTLGTDDRGLLTIEDTLIDPPVPIDAQKIGLSPIGVALIERGGVYHLLDWVGETHYPQPVDFIEEARRYGVSRRVPKTLDFAKLTHESRLIVVHPKAYIANYDLYYSKMPWRPDDWACRCDKPHHNTRSIPKEMCINLLWDDAEQDDSQSTHKHHDGYTLIEHATPMGDTYAVGERPFDIAPEYRLAIFASFPLDGITVIRDPFQGTHNAAAQTAGASGLNVSIEDE